MKRIFIGLLTGLMLSSLPLAFAQTELYTIDHAIQTAIGSNPKIKATQARLGVSDAEIVTAGTRLNPSLMSDNGIAEKTYRLGLVQTFELGGKRKRRLAVAEAQRDVLRQEINTAVLDLRAEVRRAYTRFYNLQERQATLENILKVAQELVIIAQKREKAGDIAMLDVLQTDILKINAQNDLQTMGVELVNAKNSLHVLLNQPIAAKITLAAPNTATLLISPSTPPVESGTLLGRISETETDLSSLIAEALARRPEIQQNLRNIELSRLQGSLAKANRIPNLSLAAGPDLVLEPGQTELNLFVIATMDIPVFNRQQGPIREALARENQFLKAQTALENQVRLEVMNAYNLFKANDERIKRYENVILPKSVTVTEKSRQAFREGKTSILIPIQAQQAYMNARLGYLQALADFQNAISDLERAVGTGL